MERASGAGVVPVCIFAKPPVAGQVKTRLIAELGAEGAAGLASAMLQDVWRTVEGCDGVRPVLATTEMGEFPVGVPADDVWLQGDGDLGERIERIVTRGLAEAGAVIAVGADSPALGARHLRAALDSLRSVDAVLGPSVDGGFYLLGLRRWAPGIFAGVEWSAEGTCEEVKRRLEGCGFGVGKIETLFDVDTAEDLARLQDLLAECPGAAPATRGWWGGRPCE